MGPTEFPITPSEPCPTTRDVFEDFLICLGLTIVAAVIYWAAMHTLIYFIPKPGLYPFSFSFLLVSGLACWVIPQVMIMHAAAFVMLLGLIIYRAWKGRRTTTAQQVHLLGWLMLPVVVVLAGEFVFSVGWLIFCTIVWMGRDPSPGGEIGMAFSALLCLGAITAAGYWYVRGRMLRAFPAEETILWAPPSEETKGEKPAEATSTIPWWQFSISAILWVTTFVAVSIVFFPAAFVLFPGAFRTHLVSIYEEGQGETVGFMRLAQTFLYSCLQPLVIIALPTLMTFGMLLVANSIDRIPNHLVEWRPTFGDLILAVSYIFAIWFGACSIWFLVPPRTGITE